MYQSMKLTNHSFRHRQDLILQPTTTLTLGFNHPCPKLFNAFKMSLLSPIF